jgi:hypothetical protein
MGERERFHPLFERWARGVRRRLLARRALTGLTVGLALAVLPALLAWETHHGALRPLCALGAILGAAGGLLVARRKRWSDEDVALWLDDRLQTDEAITTAVEMRHRADRDDDARAVVVSTAAAALGRADAKRARPAVLRPLHALAPLALAALIVVMRSPLPARPVGPSSPGETRIQIGQVEGLKRVAELGQASARDGAQKQRLETIARDAEKLRVDLEKGLEKRAALDRIATLRDAIAAERLTLGEGERRAGLEAAVSTLEQIEATRGAARALGDHDLEKMDREMERVANAREKHDRDSARKALEDAAAAAKARGAPDVGQALEEEKKALEEREKRAETLRDLEKAMEDSDLARPEQKNEADGLDRKESDEAARALADALGQALEKLTPEERKKLAEKLKQQARRGGIQSDPQDLRDLAEDLSTPEGQKKLEDELKDLAQKDDESPEARGQRDLDDAERSADGAEGDIEGDGNGSGNAGGDGPGGEGHHHDTGTGAHDGKTEAVPGAGTLKSRAHAPTNQAPGMPGTTRGWTPGRSGGTANVQGTGALGAAGPGEVNGVDHSDVPEEYRAQVRQYFQP